MRRLFWLALLGAALANLGCVVPSLHPLFTEKDLVSDPRMIGAWTDDDESIWVFEKSGNGRYLLSIADDRKLSAFDAHLLQLGSHRFLDLYPRTERRDDSFDRFHLLPVHTFYKVVFDGESLRLIPMHLDWLEGMVHDGNIQVAHAWPEGDLLLTAPTAELQEFVLMFADDPAAFPIDATAAMVIELEPTIL